MFFIDFFIILKVKPRDSNMSKCHAFFLTGREKDQVKKSNKYKSAHELRVQKETEGCVFFERDFG